MRRFHFVHAAGLRLHTPFAAVGRVPDRVRDYLAEAPLRAWEDLVEVCIDRGAAFLVIAGGVLGGPGQGIGGPLRLRNGLKRLADHGIKSLLALSAADAELEPILTEARISGVTVFPAALPLTVKVEHAGIAVAAVCGLSGGEPAPDLAPFFANAAAGLPQIGVLAGAVGDLDQRLAGRGKAKGAYWALGDTVEPSRRGFSPWIVESGTLQARSSAATERGARGAMLVEVEGERVLAVDHVAVDRVRYAELRLAPRFPLDDALLCHQIMDELNRLRAANAGRALLVDVVVDETDSGDPMSGADRRRALLSRLRNETASWDPFVWCDSLRSESPLPLDAVADPLGQAVIQESRALLGNPLQRSYSFARRFDSLMRRWTSELETGDAEKLVADATALALAAARPCGERPA